MTIEDIREAKSRAIARQNEARNEIGALQSEKNTLTQQQKDAIQAGRLDEAAEIGSKIPVIDMRIKTLIEPATTIKYDLSAEETNDFWNRHCGRRNITIKRKMEEYTEMRAQLCKLYVEIVKMRNELFTDRNAIFEALDITNLAYSAFYTGPRQETFNKPIPYINKGDSFPAIFNGGRYAADVAFFLHTGVMSYALAAACNTVMYHNEAARGEEATVLQGAYADPPAE